jgi:hypothetical protein
VKHLWLRIRGLFRKKRVRLNEEELKDTTGGKTVYEGNGMVSNEAEALDHSGIDITMHENPYFENDVNVKAGPEIQACLQE